MKEHENTMQDSGEEDTEKIILEKQNTYVQPGADVIGLGWDKSHRNPAKNGRHKAYVCQTPTQTTVWKVPRSGHWILLNT